MGGLSSAAPTKQRTAAAAEQAETAAVAGTAHSAAADGAAFSSAADTTAAAFQKMDGGRQQCQQRSRRPSSTRSDGSIGSWGGSQGSFTLLEIAPSSPIAHRNTAMRSHSAVHCCCSTAHPTAHNHRHGPHRLEYGVSSITVRLQGSLHSVLHSRQPPPKEVTQLFLRARRRRVGGGWMGCAPTVLDSADVFHLETVAAPAATPPASAAKRTAVQQTASQSRARGGRKATPRRSPTPHRSPTPMLLPIPQLTSPHSAMRWALLHGEHAGSPAAAAGAR